MENKIALESLKRSIINTLEQYSDSATAQKNLRFHKDKYREDFTTYGIDTPTLRKIMKQYKRELMSLLLHERLDLAEDMFSSYNEELAHIAVYMLNLSISELEIEHLKVIDKYTTYFRNWSITDDYALGVVQPLLLKYRQPVLNLLDRWSKSENLWQRRLSAVAFVRKIGASGMFTQELLLLCDRLARDSEDLVLKGVGWALKDSMRGNKEIVLGYVKKLRAEGISSTVILYAIRDIKDKAERDSILNTEI